ncbi:MAG: thioredoxin [Acetanaerobacterium sp.]
MSAFTVTKENFAKEVLQCDRPVLIDFWAPWCGPCRRVAPIVEEIGTEARGTVRVGKINVDEQPELTEMFRVMSIPTLIVMKNGKVQTSSVGAKNKQTILEMLDS